VRTCQPRISCLKKTLALWSFALALLALAVLPWPARCAEAEFFGPLVRRIEHELEDNGVPALSIILLDGEEAVLSRGFGFADLAKTVPADESTVYRVGSLSKLYTNIAVMQLVEQGRLDLDAPLTDYLPGFRPENPFGKPVTLRRLMAHRSGLVREPPVGSYFDDSPPPIREIVASLNRTRLVYEPDSRTKYSNAAIVTVGRVIEKVTGRPFADHMQENLLKPLGMDSSSFRLRAGLEKRLAEALMWSYDGREFPAPVFDVLTPAGNLYSTVADQAALARMIFRGGAPLLKPATLQAMFEPQFDPEGRFGLGFALSEFDGRRRVGHTGAVYGFSTGMHVLPDEKLAVIAAASRDMTDLGRICEHALRLLLARREGKPAPPWQAPKPVSPEIQRRVEGRYASPGLTIRLVRRRGELWSEGVPFHRVLIRRQGGGHITDGRLAPGRPVEFGDDSVAIAGASYDRRPDMPPSEAPEAWRELTGEYGWPHNTLFLLERYGRLCALIEWVFLYELTPVSADVWAFPDSGLYHGERIVFRRGEEGEVTEAAAAGVVFPKRPSAARGETFRIEPVKPVSELRRAARAAAPPAQPDGLLEPDLVDVAALAPSIRLDIRYATANNFMGEKFYRTARALLQRPAAEALMRVHRKLKQKEYGLLIHDAYRPWYVTKMFWDATPEAMKDFVADPEPGSVHNRGAAVDLTLYELETGEPVEMPSGYDEFSERAYPDYAGGTTRQRWLRDLLRSAMEAEGFTVYEYEWWHFDYHTAQDYPVMNVPLEEAAEGELKAKVQARPYITVSE